MAETKSNFLLYKGKPLVRSGDTLYYGDMSDRYVAHLQIKSKKNVNGLETADRVAVQILCTDETMNLRDRIANKTEKNSGYLAHPLFEKTSLVQKMPSGLRRGHFTFFRSGPITGRCREPGCILPGIFRTFLKTWFPQALLPPFPLPYR